MKKLKLIIVSIHIKNSPQAMPLAAGLLKAQIDSDPGIKDKTGVSILDFYMGSSAESIAQDISLLSPDMIGFSTYLWNRQLTEDICCIIRKRLPGIILFAGGAEATALPQNLLSSAPFDFVIKGDGELVLIEVIKRIIEKKPYNDIRGVHIKGQGSSPENDQSPVMEPDTLSSPFLTGVLDPGLYPGVLWELSRGCPFKCSFCFESRGVAGVRQFSLGRIQKELELFESKKVSQVFVLDPTFNRDITRAKKILRIIQKTAPLIHFTIEARTEFIDSEMAELLAGINCSLQIGLQSAIPEVLANVNRKIDPDKYAEKIAILNSAGIIFGLDLIYGLPGDTLDGFKHSLNYALLLQPNHLDIFPLAVLPGTELYDRARSFSLNCLSEAPYTLISSPGFSEADMSAADILQNACNIFYNRGGAVGWMFMVYETLGIEPVDLISNFAEFISSIDKKAELSKDRITELQISFVKSEFNKHSLAELYPVMEDIIKIHGALNRSLYTEPQTGRINTPFNDDTIFRLSPGTILLSLKYNFNDLMAVGELTLEEFIKQYQPEKTEVVIYNSEGEVKPLIINRKLSKLLQYLTAEHTLKEIIESNSSLSRDEVYEFIKHAIAERIVFNV